MIERRQYLGLARETCQPLGIERESLGQHFQRDIASEFRVARAVHLAHGADTQQADDVVRTDSDTWREDRVSRRVIRLRKLDSERIVEHGPMGRGQTIEEAALQGVRRQERLDFTTQRLIVAGLSDQKGVSLFDRPFHGRFEQRLHARPGVVRHSCASATSSLRSQALAVRQSRLTVEGDTART